MEIIETDRSITARIEDILEISLSKERNRVIINDFEHYIDGVNLDTLYEIVAFLYSKTRDKEQYWICWKNTQTSVLKGWFDTLQEAVNYFNKQERKSEMVIMDKDRKKVVYPDKEIDKLYSEY